MFYCLKCKSEYGENSNICSQCGSELIDELNMELLCNVMTEAEACLIKGILVAEEIDVFIKPLEVVMYDGVFSDMEGVWGRLFVFSKDLEKAKKILNDYLSASQEDEEAWSRVENPELLDEEEEN